MDDDPRHEVADVPKVHAILAKRRIPFGGHDVDGRGLDGGRILCRCRFDTMARDGKAITVPPAVRPELPSVPC